ncbi:MULTISPECIES: two-component system regulatory protein YycI [Lactobacillus]|uniref:Regulatory protein YycH-like domain-containing protein n=1 Tax=Lactobacillus xujianguonis TaxID=2495899 RepID=A0A437SVY2_9LACO|nr:MULTISPECIES: two-component system regulatory protein YycI [Lactobacillus]RVU71091.1 hypothetical protein EJK17_04350 [Lactobacillus xujianguonis]RVU76753.1 hypothetical protein EJK20_03775 [Lactobacillus xujianguonis]
MDHKRIEWLFLVVFLLIDIYLGIEILRSPVSLSNGNNNETDTTNIRTEMRADGIELPKNLSDTQASGYYLAAKNRDYLSDKISNLSNMNASYSKSINTLNATPKSLVEVKGNQKQVLQQVIEFKNNPDNVPYGKHFKYEANMSGDNNYTFVQTSEYGNIYDNSAQLTINVKDHAIANYTMTYMGPVNPVRELQSTISPFHAVRVMYTDRELANNSRVLKVKLGYSELTEVRGSTILLPSWLVWIENKTSKNITMKRVNAYTGQILQTNSSYNVTK